MLRKSLILSVFISFTIFGTTLAQQSILEKSDELTNKGKIAEAYQLMQKNSTTTNVKNVDFVWKIAKLAYWNGDVEASKKYYNSALKLDPNNFNIKLDYAKILFDLGDYKESIVLIKQYLANDNSSVDVQALLIKATFYDGQVRSAQNLIEKLPKPVKSAAQIIELKKEIATFKALNIGASVAYTNDDQPLETFTPRIKIGAQENQLVNWSIAGAFHNFSNDTLKTTAQTFQVGNLFHFNELKLDANVFLGATLLNSNDKDAIIGGVWLSKKINNAFALEVEASRNPYYYSIPSTQVLVTQDNLGAALVIKDLAKFTGKLQLQQQIYNDNNKINSISGWVLTPSLGKKNIQAKVGYSFDNTNSQTDNFRSVKSLNEVIQNYASSEVIAGVFDPYFTPNSQNIQNALLWLLIKPFKFVEINFTGSYALSATFENPVLFLNKNNVNQTVFDKDFIKTNYKPANYRASITYDEHKSFSSALNYEYFKSAYYTANTFMLSLNFRLINEK